MRTQRRKKTYLMQDGGTTPPAMTSLLLAKLWMKQGHQIRLVHMKAGLCVKDRKLTIDTGHI
jgi:hypothetical protein